MRVTFFTFYLVISAIIILDYRIVSFNVRIVETSSRGVQCRRDTACVTNASERARRSSHGKQRSRLFQTFRENQNSDGIKEFMQSNPLTRVFYNIYSYFYWVPKKNMPYVTPFDWVRNSSLEFIAYYQFPQNLPPYIYLGDDYPDDFFCWGLPGATLPLGNWDPFGFHQVSSKVVRKYRESELKHGRLAMMAVIGFLAQESVGHPLHPEIGGMAITHMEQLQNQGLVESFFFQQLIFPGLTALAFDTNSASQALSVLPQVPLDYLVVILLLVALESTALLRNWTRWKPNEYNHQFDHNFGLGNLKESYENGNYGFDPLNLCPSKEVNPKEWLNMQNKELNHGRLAMVAFAGLLVQEYVTGIPSLMALKIWLQHIIEGDAAAVISSSSSRGGGEIFSGISSSSPSLYAPSSINEPSKFLSGFIELLKGVPNIIGGDNQP